MEEVHLEEVHLLEAFGVFRLEGSATPRLYNDDVDSSNVDPTTRFIESTEEDIPVFRTPRHAINAREMGLGLFRGVLCRLRVHSPAIRNPDDVIHPIVWTRKVELVSIIPLNIGRNREWAEKAARTYDVPLEQPSWWVRLVAWNARQIVGEEERK
jgi:hypothetical protein